MDNVRRIFILINWLGLKGLNQLQNFQIQISNGGTERGRRGEDGFVACDCVRSCQWERSYTERQTYKATSDMTT